MLVKLKQVKILKYSDLVGGDTFRMGYDSNGPVWLKLLSGQYVNVFNGYISKTDRDFEVTKVNGIFIEE